MTSKVAFTNPEAQISIHGINEGVEEEILTYNPSLNAYSMQHNLKLAVVFIGDHEDYLNTLTDNFDPLRKKYNLGPEICRFTCSEYNHHGISEGVMPTINGFCKKSDQLNLMPYGIYSFTVIEHYAAFKPIKINVDEYVKFDNSEVDKLQKTITEFYKKRSIYEKNNSRHKGASLVYGPPGCGKTSCLMNLINNPDFKDIYTIFIPKEMSFKSLNCFKEAFAGHNTLIIMEEMTERLANGTEDILNFLDGYSSWNNCYVIATTNYPEVLPSNLVDRPGRFNHLIEVKVPTEEQKLQFLKAKGVSQVEIDSVMSATKDYSMDYIAQLVLQSKLEQLPIKECLAEFEANKKKVKNTFKGKGGISL